MKAPVVASPLAYKDVRLNDVVLQLAMRILWSAATYMVAYSVPSGTLTIDHTME